MEAGLPREMRTAACESGIYRLEHKQLNSAPVKPRWFRGKFFQAAGGWWCFANAITPITNGTCPASVRFRPGWTLRIRELLPVRMMGTGGWVSIGTAPV